MAGVTRLPARLSLADSKKVNNARPGEEEKMDQRYKKRGVQFNSALDSRALRAVQYQERRKSRRNDVFSHRRHVDALQDSMDKGRPYQNMNLLSEGADENEPKKTRKELGLARYQQLLKWKEQKRKVVEKEKKRRRPSFKTGVYHPEPPKYLVSGDTDNMGQSVNQTPGKATPFKFLQSSSRKYGTMPGASQQKKKVLVFHTGVTPGTTAHSIPRFCTGVTPGTSVQRAPKFHSGVTPNETLKRGKILGKGICSKEETEKSEVKENYVSQRTRASLKRTAKAEHTVTETRKVAMGRTARRQKKCVDTLDDLGVKQLPATPQPTQSVLRTGRRVEAPRPSGAQVVSSFAPSDFDFNFDMSKVSSRRNFLPKDNGSDAAAQGRRLSVRLFKSTVDIDSSDQTSSDVISDCSKISDDPQLGVPLKIENEVSGNKVSIERENLEFGDTITTEIDSIVNETSNKEVQILEEYVTEEQAIKEGSQNERKTSCAGDLNDVEYVAEKGGINIDAEKEIPEEKTEVDECTNFDSSVNETHDDQSDRAEKVGKSKRHNIVATPARYSTRKSVTCCDYTTPSMSRLRPRTPCSRSTRRSLSAHCDPPYEIITRSSKKASKKKSRHSVNSVMKLSNIDKVLSEESIPEFSLSESESASKRNTEVESKLNISKEKQMDEKEDLHEDTTNSDLTSKPTVVKKSSPLEITPRSHGHRSIVSWMIDVSPWIDKSRRRSANKRHSCATPDFQKLPDDIPIHGSPCLAHHMPLSDGLKSLDKTTVVDDALIQDSPEVECKVSEDQTCMKLLPLLEPSSPASHMNSPDIDVWSIVSPALPSSASDPTTTVPDTSRKTVPEILNFTPGSVQEIGLTHSAQTATKMLTSTSPASGQKIPTSPPTFNSKIPTTTSVPVQTIQTELAASPKLSASFECKENEEPSDQSLLPKPILPGKSAGGKRKSRRSVMFTLKEQENDATPTFRFPGTPIRSSSRVSMGLFSKVDMTTDTLFPCDQDLINLDSPKSEKKTKATRRKSSRVSLLPGMKLSPAAVQESPISQDLIKWDTPLESKKRNSRRSSVTSYATPSRRSRRLNKAPVL